MVGDRSPIGVRQAEAKDDRRLLVVDCNRSAITLLRGAKHGCTQILKFGEVSKIWNQSVVLNLRSRFILGLHIT